MKEPLARILGRLDRGGMADIFVAERIVSGAAELVAIKTVRALEPAEIAMFLDEARVATRLHHPNVVETFACGESDGAPYLMMEFLEGQPFERLLRAFEAGATTPARALRLSVFVVSEALAGLHHAHEARDHDRTPLGLVHRDCAPRNLFVTYDGRVKLLDFGIAKALQNEQRTAEGLIKGNVRTMSPEQALALPLDRRADIFVMGLVLFESASGKRPWQGLRDAEVYRALVDGSYPTRVPEAPAALNDVLARALCRDASQRHETAESLRFELLAWLASTRDEAPRAELQRVMKQTFGAERARLEAAIASRRATAGACREPLVG